MQSNFVIICLAFRWDENGQETGLDRILDYVDANCQNQLTFPEFSQIASYDIPFLCCQPKLLVRRRSEWARLAPRRRLAGPE